MHLEHNSVFKLVQFVHTTDREQTSHRACFGRSVFDRKSAEKGENSDPVGHDVDTNVDLLERNSFSTIAPFRSKNNCSRHGLWSTAPPLKKKKVSKACGWIELARIWHVHGIHVLRWLRTEMPWACHMRANSIPSHVFAANLLSTTRP